MFKNFLSISPTMAEIELKGTMPSSLVDDCDIIMVFAALYMEVR